MLRDLIDMALLEDILAGLARASGLRLLAYDQRGVLIASASAPGDGAWTAPRPPARLPCPLELTALPAEGPPARIACLKHQGAWHVVAPVYVQGRIGGYMGASERPARARKNPSAAGAGQLGAPPRAAAAARWSARLLSQWCARELRMQSASEQTALVGDIAELLSGEPDLQVILDRIVARTAAVMKCRFCSLRLYDPQTDELTIKAGHNLSPAYLAKGSVLRRQNPIDDQALRGRVVHIADASRDPRVRFREEARRQGIVSGLTTGMLYRGKPIGVLRVYTDHRQRFRQVHRNLLRAVASQAAIAIVNARLLEERIRTAETERQLALAAQVQARMVRSRPKPHPLIETACVFEPASQLAGDFCDFLTLADGRLAAVVGDVVGAGVPAALLMASVRGALRASAQCGLELGEILARLNDHVHAETTSAEFVTLLLVAVERGGRGLTYCNAGHEPLLLLRQRRVHSHGQAGLVLGLRPGETYSDQALELQAGDFVLLYTDGVIEAMDFRGRHFGRRRLHDALLSCGHLPAELALRNILWDVRRFVGLASQSDDMTMVGLRVRGQPGLTARPA